MKRKQLDHELLDFIRPIYRGEAKKGILMFICFMNILGSMIIWNKNKSMVSLALVLIGVFLAAIGFFILRLEDRWIEKAIYGFCETLFLLILSYFTTYMEYKETGYSIGPYISFTQLIGSSIFLISILILYYRLKHSFKGTDEKKMINSIKLGIGISIGLIILIFVGVFLLYYLKQDMHLVESSKMLYVAMVLNIVAAYYTLKVLCCIKHYSEIKQIH